MSLSGLRKPRPQQGNDGLHGLKRPRLVKIDRSPSWPKFRPIDLPESSDYGAKSFKWLAICLTDLQSEGDVVRIASPHWGDDRPFALVESGSPSEILAVQTPAEGGLMRMPA